MILAENLIKALKKNNIDFYTGVPDSILKKFSACLEKLPKKNHIYQLMKVHLLLQALVIIYQQKKLHAFIFKIQV